MTKDLLLVHIILTAFMVGLIWTIQLVHYPSFLYVEKSVFSKFETFHAFRISLIVLPIMILELVTAIWLFLKYPQNKLLILNGLLLGVIWLTTLLISSRIHGQLTSGYNESLINKLVSTNWPRTLLWSGRLIILFFLMKSTSL